MNKVVYFHGIRVVYVWTAMCVEDHFFSSMYHDRVW